MQALLSRLTSLLSEKRASYFSHFDPGATNDDLAAFETALGFPVAEEVRAFYRWRNGHPKEIEESFQNHMGFLSLESSLAEYRMLTALLAGSEFATMKHWWCAKWVPLLEGPNGDLLCVDMGGAFDGQPGQMIDFVQNDLSRDIVAPNLSSWLESYCGLLDDGLLDEYGIVDSDDYVWVRGIAGYPLARQATR